MDRRRRRTAVALGTALLTAGVAAGLTVAYVRHGGQSRPVRRLSAIAPAGTTVETLTRPVPASPARPRPTAPSQEGPGWRPIAVSAGLDRLDTATGVVLRIDPVRIEVALVPGTAEPAAGFPAGGAVPVERRHSLIAATNAGFKRHDAGGGEMIDGRTVGALTAGAASLVVHGSGSVDIGAWGQGVGPGPDNVAVLQNLMLLVDHGQATAGLDRDVIARWGATFLPNLPVAVWRSGLGVDSAGRLLYAAGPNIVPAQLAALLVGAGAVRAMELDINHKWVFGALYGHSAPPPDTIHSMALLAGMGPDPAHVLRPGDRDFVAFYQR